MVKYPVAGAVKTRLAKDIGEVAATRFFRVTASNIIRRLTFDRRWTTKLAVSPDSALNRRNWRFVGDKIFGGELVAQGRGDLGHRMQRIFNLDFKGPIIIIGTDIPEITPSHVDRAFRILRQKDAVIGPAGDGGYWLIGLRRAPRLLRIFDNVDWSSSTTLDDTLENLKNFDVGFCETLNDVDELADFRRLSGVEGRFVLVRTGKANSCAPPGAA